MNAVGTDPSRSGDILVVNDAPADPQSLTKFLSEAGYEVRVADEGQSALRSAQARHPALILLDIGLPGTDGFEVCRRLKADAATCDIPVVFLSSVGEAGEKAKGFELGAVDYIVKPFQPEEVLARIRTHLALAAAREQLKTQNLQLRQVNEQLTHEIAKRTRAEEDLAAALTRLQAISEWATRAQEEERRKIAFELHEQSGQELSTLKYYLQLLEEQSHGRKVQAYLRDARSLAELTLERVRSMSQDLRPAQLDDFGLYAALRAHCAKQAEAAGWVIHIDAPDSGERPHRDVELACFRVVQAGLANIARHAKATEVWIVLRNGADGLQLILRDNGTGFDAARIDQQMNWRSLELLAMQERVRQVGGRLEIRSSPDNGTEIQAIFPSPNKLPG